MIYLVDKDVKTVIITIFHIFKKSEERISTIRRERNDILKDPD